MSDRNEVPSRLMIDGRPYLVNLIHNPTIDDVVVTEARLYAAEIQGIPVEPHRVSLDLRDFLIRIGVDR